MEFSDFKDIHKGGEVICIGNGPSLNNVSIDFLRSRPSFGLNYITTYNELLDGFVPTYWLALDGTPMEVIPTLPDEIPKFIPRRHKRNIPQEYVGVVEFDMGDMDRPGGMGYGTSLLAAAHIASVHMGAKRVFLVGFDCAKAMKSIKPFQSGKTGCPHFYDPEHEPKEMGGWCNMFGIFDKWLRARGQEIINLSNPTFCNTLEKDSFLNWRHNEQSERA